MESPIRNIARHLSEMAKRHPFQEAVIFPSGRDAFGRAVYSHLTYAQLDEASDVAARGLLALGIGAGVRTAFMVKPSLEFFVLTFALFKAKAIPVLIDPGIGLKSMKRCLYESDAEAFIGIPAAHAARILLRWRGRYPAGRWPQCLSISPRRFLGIPSYEDLMRTGRDAAQRELPETAADELAAILFTSGSTGAPKGVLYTHQNFLAQVELLRSALKIEVGERDLCTFPLFALFAPALGMTAIIPEMDFTRPGKVDPEKIREAIDSFGIQNMFGSPALIKRVAQHGVEQRWHFPSLRRVISAGAPVQASVIAMFRQLLPGEAKFYTPYGATESLPVAIAESAVLLGSARLALDQGRGICVGRPVAATECKILRISDRALDSFVDQDLMPRGEIGEIIVSGRQVTRSYYQRPEANALSKVFDQQGVLYHRMGDLGYLDADGCLWFCGRKSQRVRTESHELYTIPCEAVFNRHPLVARSALIGLGKAPHERPALCVEPRRKLSKQEKASLFAELKTIAEKHEHTRSIQSFFVHPEFPVDIRHNAKIFREKLKQWAESL